MTAYGPTLPTFALQQVVGYLGYTGRAADVVATAACDPNQKFEPLAGRVLAFSLIFWSRDIDTAPATGHFLSR
jgi:hypothetical protein